MESGLCSATTTILSSLSTVTENTAILPWQRQGDGQDGKHSHAALCSSFRHCSLLVVPSWRHSPTPVDEFHGLHRQRRGHDVVGIVPPPADHDETIHFAGDEDEAAGADEAQQAGTHEGVVADQPAAGAQRVNLQQSSGYRRSSTLTDTRPTHTSKVFFVIPVRP